MLETLYKNTPSNFYVYLIDQTADGIDYSLARKYPNLMIIRTPVTQMHRTGNLGFAKGTNLGVALVETPYMTFVNDDVEFIDPRWWEGVLQTFDKVDHADLTRPCMMVNPSSIKLPDWSVGRPKGDDFYILPYKESYTPQEYDDLVNKDHYINEHLTLQPGSVIDGVTMYCSVVKTRAFLEVGLLDEHYFPGGGEDYDYNCRANMANYRCVGTTMSWIFHHWSKSMNEVDSEKLKSLMQEDLKWNNNDEKWGKGFDIWGPKCPICQEYMRCRPGDSSVAACPKHPDQRFQLPPYMLQPL